MNPARGVDLPRLRPSRRRYLTHDQVLDLLDAAGDDALPIAVLAYTGIRWGELAGMRVRSLDFLRRRLEVVETLTEIAGVLADESPKDHDRRSVVIPAQVLDQLARQVEGKAPADRVFTSRRGTPLRSSNFRRDVFDPAATAAGLVGLVPHELRHTAASLLISGGANVLAVARQLGHADPSVTLRVYADLFDDDLDSLGSRLDEAIKIAAAMRSRSRRGAEVQPIRSASTAHTR